jgi:protein involved in polysaccharide export with SLBB domain
MSTIKISDLLRGDPAADIQILSGDILDVARASAVYVIGAVNNPRPVYSRAEITLSRAVASAGGLAKDSDGGKVTIFRREGTESTITEADLAKIKRGETNDVVLKPFDIIDVAGKGGSKRKFPPVAPSTDNSANKRELPMRVID